MMRWLLKYEGYPSGVIVAILLHALLIYIVLPNKFDPANMVKIEQPSYVTATVSKNNPQRMRQLQELERQRQQDAARERRNREAEKAAEEQQKREQAKLDADRKLAAEKKAAEAQTQKERETAAAAEREKQAAREKQEQAQREADKERVAREQAAREAAEKEAAANQAAAAAAQAEALSAENQLIAQYTAIIHDVVSSNWIQPPSTRNGMQVLINIKLVPTGEIVSSVVIQSSGDPIFDRSALQAVDRAGSFPELRDLPIAVFERNFRNFNLLFSPEDLLR